MVDFNPVLNFGDVAIFGLRLNHSCTVIGSSVVSQHLCFHSYANKAYENMSGVFK